MNEFCLLNEEVAVAAVEEGNKLGFQASYSKNEDDKFIVSYASYNDKSEGQSIYMPKDEFDYYRSAMTYEMKYLREDINQLWKTFRLHEAGHLPPIKDAGKLEAALKTLGLEDSFNVSKPTIWADY